MYKFNPEELSDFARFYGFHYDAINPHALVKEILIEKEHGLAGGNSSLAMIPSYITPVIRIPAGKTVLALDAGGTNLRSSLVQFNENGEAVAQKTNKTPMPGTTGYASAQQFFDAIADVTIPLLKDTKVDGIGFTFSYPMEITPDSDGILLAFSKEVNAPEVIGKSIGKELRGAMEAKGCKYSGPIVMLNDTVATLLSGIASISPDGEAVRTGNDFNALPGPVVGFILGTGINTAYPETNIPKINFNSVEHPQIIVCETGNFKVRNRGQLDMEYDSTTKNPGKYLLEKSASGAYLGPLTLHILKQAVKDKVISFKKSDELLAITNFETRFLNEFTHAPLRAEGPLGSLFAPDETGALAAVQYITSIVTERGAIFSAALVAAAVRRIHTCYEPYSPVRIAVEGTTYLIYKGMRRSLESHLHQMLTWDKPHPYVITPVEQASLFGAAVAALSKR
uniref:Hexokinase (Hxk) n=1 Tax=uncultured bacterium contig00051 TaxID=1181535 RepID=A0A806KHT9_9BACT|nr:hexokinase (hxk) [uncultured bacterium contig00051]